MLNEFAAATEEETSGDLEDELMTLSREQIKLTESIQNSLGGTEDSDMHALIGQINLLAALRASSEADNLSLPPSRTASSMGKNSRNPKRKADQSSVTSTEDLRDNGNMDSSAAASPKVSIPATSRLKGTSTNSRAGSVPAGRETSVKVEDSANNAPPLESGIDIRDRSRLTVGMEVLYRKKAKDSSDGEGILCVIHSIIGEGKQRRYEIRDVDPDSAESIPYRAGLQQMTPIPPAGMTLPDLPLKKGVLALYPQTETFYKAEVVPALKKGSGGGETGTPVGYVRLKFEGEEELGKELDVERRYVLPDWVGK